MHEPNAKIVRLSSKPKEKKYNQIDNSFHEYLIMITKQTQRDVKTKKKYLAYLEVNLDKYQKQSFCISLFLLINQSPSPHQKIKNQLINNMYSKTRNL